MTDLVARASRIDRNAYAASVLDARGALVVRLSPVYATALHALAAAKAYIAALDAPDAPELPVARNTINWAVAFIASHAPTLAAMKPLTKRLAELAVHCAPNAPRAPLGVMAARYGFDSAHA